MFNEELPVFVTETLCATFLPTVVVPKLTLAGVIWTEPGETVCFLLLFALAIPVHPESTAIQNSAKITSSWLLCHLSSACRTGFCVRFPDFLSPSLIELSPDELRRADYVAGSHEEYW